MRRRDKETTPKTMMCLLKNGAMARDGAIRLQLAMQPFLVVEALAMNSEKLDLKSDSRATWDVGRETSRPVSLLEKGRVNENVPEEILRRDGSLGLTASEDVTMRTLWPTVMDGSTMS